MNITNLRLLNVPLEADYKHTLYFDKPDEQTHYFSMHSVGDIYTNFSYQRKDHKIRVPKQFDELNGKVNYVMYRNTAYNKDKWFYAFIIDMQYVNDGVTDVYIKTDVIQTWMFDYELKSCFVEREHTKDDSIGANTVPEGLETGEYICNNVIENKSTELTSFIIASSVDLDNGTDSGVNVYNGVLNGWYYYHFNNGSEVNKALKDIAKLRTNDAIVSIFIMPRKYIHTTEGSNFVSTSYGIPKFTYWDGEKYDDGDYDGDPIIKPKTVDGYEPKNNKLLTYPYSYLLIDNNCGGVANYHYELFDDKGLPEYKDKCVFVIYGCITPSGSLRLIPVNYNGVGENHHFGLNSGKFPVCGWQGDYYTNWLTQNALNIEVQTESIKLSQQQNNLNDMANVVGGGLSLDFDTALRSGTDMYFNNQHAANQIKGMVAQKEMHAFQSPTVSGAVASGDINYCMGNIKFTAYQMSVKKEFARIIDGYFSMYGYQVNRVKKPYKNHRPMYWYTKTIGCEIDGAIPNNDMQVIKSCYDNGITFWKDHENIGNYTGDGDVLFTNKKEGE